MIKIRASVKAGAFYNGGGSMDLTKDIQRMSNEVIKLANRK